VTEDQRRGESPSEEQTAEDTWREVGRQFEALGESLSKAFRAAWENEQTQQHVRSMRDGLEKMVDKVDRAVKEAGESEQGKRLRAEAEKTAESLREAGEQTWQETRPELVSALTTVNAELQRLIDSLEKKPSSDSQPPGQGQEA
jgi:hypothetical protein